MRKYDLKDRLTRFAIAIIEITKHVKKDYAGKHLSAQLTRSGTSVALNYGEAQSAESRRDFIHKLKVSLKELRETIVCLEIIKGANLSSSVERINKTLVECDEIAAILSKSINTAQNNM